MKKVGTLLSYLFIFFMALITVFPFIYMILGGLMTYQESISIPPTLFPAEIQWNNINEVFAAAPFLQYFVNTIFVSLMSTFGTVLTTILAGFALVKLEFKHKNLLMLVLISLMMVPYEAIVFTNYRTIAKMGLLDTYTALIIPSLASVFYIFYFKNYLASIPISFYKAAKIDGCTDLEFIWKVMIPLAKPALVTIGILSFISGWNSFLWPILVTNTPRLRLLNNGLSAFATESGSSIHLQMSAATLTIVPVLIIYFIFRKQIIQGVAKNGIKG